MSRPEKVGTVCDGFIHSLEGSGELQVFERVEKVRKCQRKEMKLRKWRKVETEEEKKVRSWRRTGINVPSNTRQECRESSDDQTCESVGGKEKASENRRRGRSRKRCRKRGDRDARLRGGEPPCPRR
jgi:hypothetical protein